MSVMIPLNTNIHKYFTNISNINTFSYYPKIWVVVLFRNEANLTFFGLAFFVAKAREEQ